MNQGFALRPADVERNKGSMMSIKSAIWAGSAALALFCAPAAMALPPTQNSVLNGTYSFSFIKTCQATITYSPASGAITSVTAPSGDSKSNAIKGTLAAATFDGSGNVSLTGNSVLGALLLIQAADDTTGQMTASDAPAPTTYTVTDASTTGSIGTFQIGPYTYNAYFGQFNGNVAQYMLFDGVPDTSPQHCIVHGEAYMIPAVAG